ncbi:FAS1 domain-containing protein [Chaetomium tenue]|uniref:FAS1 domain-containing protein n=1 Tax=Chaetomium tenue TaxID=1854479 RepID=A0ACB7PHH9_9PEZI|nr:FAS1 domain-containing protein [Chaetomium globosum]
MRFFLFLFSLVAATLSFAQSLPEVIAAQSGNLSTLAAWLASEPLVNQILGSARGITLLAPSNNALAQLYGSALATDLAVDPNLLAAFLSYHVLEGVYPLADFANVTAKSAPTFLNLAGYSNVTGGQVVQSRFQNGGVAFLSGKGVLSTVTACDLNHTGGTMHIIDTPLMMPTRMTDTLVADGFTGAVGALRQAAIEEPLNNAADMTLFVPNNDAFNAIGSVISTMTIDQLTTVLNYHVVQGQVLYSQHMAAGTQRTAQGANLNFRAVNGSLFVNSARVIATDLIIANGVVHVLDGVLNPANTTATPNPSAATQVPAFIGAKTTTGGVPFTSVVATQTVTAPTHSPTAGGPYTAPAPTARPTGPPTDGAAPRANLALGMVVVAGCAAMVGSL